MAQIRGQLRQLPLDVEPGAVPLDKPRCRKRVPEILQAWSVPPPTGPCRGAQTTRARQHRKHAPGGPPVDAQATLREQERLTARSATQVVASVGVLLQGLASRGLDRHDP